MTMRLRLFILAVLVSVYALDAALVWRSGGDTGRIAVGLVFVALACAVTPFTSNRA